MHIQNIHSVRSHLCNCYKLIQYSLIHFSSSFTVYCILTYFLVPTTAPSHLQLLQVTTDFVSVTWNPLSNFCLNGNLTEYEVNLKEIDTNILKSYYTNKVIIELRELKTFTKYSVQVGACTSAGCGPMSQELPFTIDEAGIVKYYLLRESERSERSEHTVVHSLTFLYIYIYIV